MPKQKHQQDRKLYPTTYEDDMLLIDMFAKNWFCFLPLFSTLALLLILSVLVPKSHELTHQNIDTLYATLVPVSFLLGVIFSIILGF